MNIGIFLTSILQKRQSENPSYSLRAFARDLGLSNGRLSDLLSGKSNVGLKVALRISDALELKDNERERFLLLADQRFEPAPTLRAMTFLESSILALIGTQGFRNDLEWMAARLGEPAKKLEEVIKRLIEEKLITSTGKTLTLERENAAHLIEGFGELSATTSLTFAVNVKKIKDAQRLIKEFRRRLQRELQSGPRHEVYEVTIQLIPVSRPEK
ncbi:MAG: helix-turn-helix domain-containing protein [Bdellovibrionaceae bacterium]|nr:helix-turn-helix domain-containing protein [Pseudobdellovibrionaceae bacterium]